jgi:hypothetical protein
MKSLLTAIFLLAFGHPILAQECTFAQSQPVKNDGKSTAHIDPCGNLYETGYRLEGNELRFPGGGLHRLPDGNQEEAERILRETYGLQGERDKLIRTIW